jgi:hypothetical protein
MNRFNNIKGYLFSGILFLLLGCNSMNSKQDAAVNPHDCEWYPVAGSKLSSKENKMDVYVLRYYANNKYVLCADLLFETGTWQQDEQLNAVLLKPDSQYNSAKTMYVRDVKTPEGKTVFSIFNENPTEAEPAEIIEVQAVANKAVKDPFNILLHEWRIKPDAAESKEQIKKRVLQYLNFLEVFYEHAMENSLENPGGTWYAQPVKFYSNKVSMAYADELMDWYNCFYNDEQGIEGYKLLSGALIKVKIEGADDNSRNLNCVRQMIALVQKT